MANPEPQIPFIDPRVRHVGVSKLREFNADMLEELGESVYVLRADDRPLAVLLSYEAFLAMQEDRDAR